MLFTFARTLLISSVMIMAIQTSATDDIRLWKAPSKKLIGLGWDIPDPAYIRKNIRMMEQNAPYDGIAIKVDVEVKINDKDSFNAKYTNIFQNKKWEREWFKPLIDDLKNTEFKKFTDNFILLTVCPGNADWFDDNAWKTVCNNFSIMAWLAKESGCKGIFLDMEQYSNNKIFRYAPASKHSFEETWAKARERGAQFIKAITQEYPDIVLFTCFWLDLNYKISDSQNLPEALKTQAYGLTVPFINGIYDAVPPAVKIIEGHEAGGYHAKSPYDYLTLKSDYIPLAKPLLSPENIDKFLTQTSFAVGTYLDCYVNDTGIWVTKSKDMSRIDLFRRNIRLALQYSDEYSWMWGEQCKWWPIKLRDWKEKKSSELPGKGKLWEEALPGITAAIADALRYTTDSKAYAISEIKKGKLKNLINNPGFDTNIINNGTVSPPPDCIEDTQLNGWQTWQYREPKRPARYSDGTFSLDRDCACKTPCAAKLTTVKEGSVLQSIPVKPGETYFVRASSLLQNTCTATLSIMWRNSDMRWAARQMDKKENFDKKLENGWKEASVAVTVPKGVSYMTVLFEAKSQGISGDICWLDDVEVYKLFE